LIGAANTLWFEDGKLWATNTDAYGFAANLDSLVPGWDGGGNALVIGAGGASRAIIHALLERGFASVHVANRTHARAQELADRFGPRVSAHGLEDLNELAGDVTIAVNTTSLGMKGEGEVPMDLTRLPESALATDIVYVPLETPFLKAARLAGRKTADGLGMLLHQAVPGFHKWFGVRPEVTLDLRAIIENDLGVKR
jgi:shikimate dehydrogenase